MYSTRSQTRSAAASATVKTSSTGNASSSSSLAASASTTYIEEDGVLLPQITVVSWLQILLDPVLKSEVLSNTEAGLKNTVTLRTDEVLSSATRELLEKAGDCLGDQIKLSISYADTTLNWAFSFCWCDPSLPPDITFDDPEFQPELTAYEEFVHWDPFSSVHCFKDLLCRLFSDYRKYQFALCEKHHRFELELNTLRAAGVADEHFDLYTYRGGARDKDVVFVFPVHAAAVADLPAKYLSYGAVDDRVRLKIRFTLFGDGKAHADLELTPFFNKLFNAETLKKLPPMTCLVAEYVHEIREILDEEVSLIGDAYKFRRDLITAFIAAFPRETLIDYSSEDFTSVSFLLDHQDFKYVCKIVLLSKAPLGGQAVKVSFSSVYHESKDTSTRLLSTKKLHPPPMAMEATLPAISARSTAEEAMEKIREHINTKVGQFKKESCQRGV